jgi:hypothetical protein
MQEKDKMPSEQKQDIFKGIVLMFTSLPFIFLGPSLMFGAGIPQFKEGNYTMFIVSVALMVAAGIIGVTGLKKVLNAFFNNH